MRADQWGIPHMSGFQPAGRHTVTPRIVVRDPENLVRFVNNVFCATGEYRAGMPAEIRIGDSIVMVSGEGARDPIPAFLYVSVEDTDATYRRAFGATGTLRANARGMP